jgi:hypothetical protein
LFVLHVKPAAFIEGFRRIRALLLIQLITPW